jgi:hypothetical protein
MWSPQHIGPFAIGTSMWREEMGWGIEVRLLNSLTSIATKMKQVSSFYNSQAFHSGGQDSISLM